MLHWCGVNLLLVLAKDFPNIQEVLDDIAFNQTGSLPINMTDCTFISSRRIDVICQAPHWTDQIDTNQVPSRTRHLQIHNTSLCDLQAEDFGGKTVHVLDLSYHSCLSQIHQETFEALSQSLQALVIKDTKFKAENVTNFLSSFRPLVYLRHLILEENSNLNLQNVSLERQENEEPFLNQLEYLSFEGSNLQKIESELFWPLRNASRLKQLNLRRCNLTSIAPKTFEHLPFIEHIDFSGNLKLLQIGVWFETPFLISLQSINAKSFRHFGLANNGM